ncbi:hypothetical protein RO3G_16411 [Lichtheimia corymbifera JMRC:FSU:9682]|uniref:SWIRM domain-containing protein n=1 Tax=Lichtheimia corymbifera JMRC:FSU:9682 TaxID=1263082 RepID=A0A068S6B5_9FUNG|nr:hypothetical protein RO3G_16411 [Lichtheimia corymbifera JMRC:FSU:9682]
MDSTSSSRDTLPSCLQIQTLCKINDPPSSLSYSPPTSPSSSTLPSLPAMLSSPPPTPTSMEQDHTAAAFLPPYQKVPGDKKPIPPPSGITSRKQFIHAYARMAPYLRPTHSCLFGKRHDLSQIGSALLSRHTDNHNDQDNGGLITPPSPPYTTLILDRSVKRPSRSLSCDWEHRRRCHSPHDIADPPKKSSSTTKTGSARDMSHKDIPPSPLVSHKKKVIGEAPIKTTTSTRRPSSNRPATSSNGNANGGELRIKGLTLHPAYTFDTLNIDNDDHDFFPSDWVPNPVSLDQVPVDVSWKGQPMPPDDHQPYLNRLHPQEVKIISHMRMTPAVYLRCKRAIIMAAREFTLHHQEFRKSDAQKVCRIDVNKSSRLWALFHAYNWLSPHHPTAATTTSQKD